MKAFVITLLAVLGVAVASCGPAPFGGACGSPCGSPCGGWGGWGFPGGGWGGCGFPGGGGCGGWGWGGPVGNTWNNFGNQNAACAQGAATQFGRGMNVANQGWNNAAENTAASRFGCADQAAARQKAAAINSNAGQCAQQHSYKDLCLNDVLIRNVNEHARAGTVCSNNAFVNARAAENCADRNSARGQCGATANRAVCQSCGGVGCSSCRGFGAENSCANRAGCCNNGGSNWTFPGGWCAPTPFYW